jgi:hypothetical protein
LWPSLAEVLEVLIHPPLRRHPFPTSLKRIATSRTWVRSRGMGDFRRCCVAADRPCYVVGLATASIAGKKRSLIFAFMLALFSPSGWGSGQEGSMIGLHRRDAHRRGDQGAAAWSLAGGRKHSGPLIVEGTNTIRSSRYRLAPLIHVVAP